MRPRQILVLLVTCFVGVTCAAGDNKSSPLTEQHRIELIRTFNADLVYIRTQFPMGKTGLTLKGGKVSPNGEALSRLLAMWGPSVKAGDSALITPFLLKNEPIHFEINGGPGKKKQWYPDEIVGGRRAGGKP